MYDEKYHFAEEKSMSDNLFRMGPLEEGENFERINRGTFYQNAAKIDDIQDPGVSIALEN